MGQLQLQYIKFIKDANKAYDMGFRIYKMRIIKPDTILNLVKDFKKEFSNRMELIVDAVQGSTANHGLTKFLLT